MGIYFTYYKTFITKVEKIKIQIRFNKFDSFFIELLFFLCLTSSSACLCRWAIAEWKIETVDSVGVVGRYTSLAFDPLSRHPAISYYGNTDLKYARFNGISWDIIIVDSAEIVGLYTSLAFDTSGKPAISYYDSTNARLKYAHFDGTSSSWVTKTVDPAENVGEFTSLAFDASGKPGISYYDGEDAELQYAHFNGTSWDVTIVDSSGDVYGFTSLAFDPISGNPAISYYDWNNAEIKYAARLDGASWDIKTVDFLGGDDGYTSLAFDTSGKPAISYYDWTNETLKYARFVGTSWVPKTIDKAKDVGGYTSLAFDASGKPAISYYDWSNGDLKYAHFNGTSWDITTVASSGDVGEFTSLAFDASGNPAISYYAGYPYYDLKYARFVPKTSTCQCSADSIPPLGCISGVVTDRAGQPLAGKTVTLNRTFPKKPVVKGTATTGPDGCYQFADLENGTYKIKVTRCKGGGKRKISDGNKVVENVNFACK